MVDEPPTASHPRIAVVVVIALTFVFIGLVQGANVENVSIEVQEETSEVSVEQTPLTCH